MNHVSLVGQLAATPSYTAPVGGRPARAAFSIGVPRRGTIAVDWIGVTAIGAQAEALTAVGLTAPDVLAVEGYLHTTSPAGDGHYQLEVVALHVQRLDLARTPASQEATS